jgi:hypothetical protein
MLRDHVAPALRAQGLKGSGMEYSVPSASHWILLGFQGSTANTSGRMKFTVNCKVVRKDVWSAAEEERPFIGLRPKANVGAGSFEWTERIGRLMPAGEDKWWWLKADDPPDVLGREVLDAITRYALPAMRRISAETA